MLEEAGRGGKEEGGKDCWLRREGQQEDHPFSQPNTPLHQHVQKLLVGRERGIAQLRLLAVNDDREAVPVEVDVDLGKRGCVWVGGLRSMQISISKRCLGFTRAGSDGVGAVGLKTVSDGPSVSPRRCPGGSETATPDETCQLSPLPYPPSPPPPFPTPTHQCHGRPVAPLALPTRPSRLSFRHAPLCCHGSIRAC